MSFSAQLIKTMKPKNVEELAIINAAIRPAGESYRDDLTKRIRHISPNHEVDEALASTYSFMVFQEQIMMFLQKFCGFSGSDSDNIRRAIGSKSKEVIDKQIPIIIDAYCRNRDIDYETAKKEAEEYVQVIKDASSYAFNKSHAVAYSMLGYVFAYMKHYHPAEFICAFLNYADNEEDIVNGTKLAKERGFSILPPKFRYSSDNYMYDLDSKTITKGIQSIKYMNANVAIQLYNLRNSKYNSFFDVLYEINKKTNLTARQLDILIKLDYFIEFGNANLLLRYVEIFNQFYKNNKFVSSVAVNNLTQTLYEITTKYGKTSNTRISITDVNGILSECNERLLSSGIKDLPLKDKIATQKEYLGYITLRTGKLEDKTKLIILECTKLIAKKGKKAGECWAVKIKTHSVGRGRSGEFMIKFADYNKYGNFQSGNIIQFNERTLHTEEYLGNKQYWIKDYFLVL